MAGFISVGKSVRESIREAINEALSNALKELKGEPALVLVFPSFSKYGNASDVSKVLKERLGEVPYVAISTAGEYFMDEALNKSVVVEAFSKEVFKASVGAAKGAQEDGVRAGKEAAERALEGIDEVGFSGLRPSLVAIVNSAPGREEEVLRGVREVLGPYVPIIGGSSGDDFALKPPFGYQVTPELSGSGLAVVTLIKSKLRFEIIGGHACRLTGTYGIVTDVGGGRGEVVLKIGNVRAADVYARWLSKDVNYVKGNMLSLGLKNPLGIKDPVTGDVYVKHPAAVTDEGGIACFASVPKNSVIHLLEHDLEASVRLGEELVKRAKELLGELEGVLLIHCAGSSAYLGDKRGEFIRRLYEVAKAPVAGFAAYGEQWGSYRYSTLVAHNNLTTAILAFSK